MNDLYTVDPSTGCWNWNGEINPYGYGVIRENRTTVFAHKRAFESKCGLLHRGQVTDHLCRNRRCVNPDHLEAISNTENVRRGAACKLSVEKVTQIRHEYARGISTQKALAARFEMHPAAISKIINGHSWISEIETPLITRRQKTSRHRGVTFNKNARKWMAFVSISRVFKYLGLYSSEDDAAQAVQIYQSQQQRG